MKNVYENFGGEIVLGASGFEVVPDEFEVTAPAAALAAEAFPASPF